MNDGLIDAVIGHEKPSIWVGTTFLPLERTRSSFLRPVIFRYPSASSEPMSPV